MPKRSAAKPQYLPARRVLHDEVTPGQLSNIIEHSGVASHPGTRGSQELSGHTDPPPQHVHIHYHAASSYSIESTSSTRTTIYYGSGPSILSGHSAPSGRGGRIGGVLLALVLWAIVLGIVAAIATAILAARELGS